MMRARWVMVAVWALLCVAGVGFAQETPRVPSADGVSAARQSPSEGAAGVGVRQAPRGERLENQGWFVVSVGGKVSEGQPRVVLFQVPPRAGPGGAADGTLRPSGELVQMPTAWCVRGASLYMLFEEAPRPPAFPGPPKPRRVLTVKAVRSDTGAWRTEPSGRPDVLPSLDGAGVMIDMVGAGPGVFALRRVEGSLRLDMMRQGPTVRSLAWEEVQGWPTELRLTEDRVAIAGSDRGVIVAQAGAGTLWSVNVTGDTPTWTARPLGEMGEQALRRVDGLLTVCAGQLLASWTDELGAFHVISRPLDAKGEPTAGEGWRALATQPGVFAAFTPVGMDADERLAVMYNPPPAEKQKKVGSGAEGKGGASEPESRLLEMSARTGRVLYDGPIRLAAPISGADYVLMGAVMWVVLGMVVAGIVPPREGVVVIAEGSSIAEPVRRVAAGAIDFSLAMLAVSRIEGVPLDEVLTLAWWSTPAGELVVLQALGALVVVCTVLECLLGRTPGKLVTGCEVLSTKVRLGQSTQGEARPTVWQALVRNVLKWGLPPLGALGVMDPSGRGRHDQFARTAVIVRYVAEDEPLDDDLDG